MHLYSARNTTRHVHIGQPTEPLLHGGVGWPADYGPQYDAHQSTGWRARDLYAVWSKSASARSRIPDFRHRLFCILRAYLDCLRRPCHIDWDGTILPRPTTRFRWATPARRLGLRLVSDSCPMLPADWRHYVTTSSVASLGVSGRVSQTKWS